jgi:surface protein
MKIVNKIFIFSSSLFFIACGGGGLSPIPSDENSTEYEESGVLDKIKPVITINGNNITINQGDIYRDAGATAIDDRDGDITDKIQTFSTVDNSKEGIYTIIYTVNDNAGNMADFVSRTVKVINATQYNIVLDTTKPIITLNGENNITININTVYTDAGATAIDDRDGDITDKIQTFSTVDSSKEGTYSIIYVVNDNAGNVADIISRTIHIIHSCDNHTAITRTKLVLMIKIGIDVTHVNTCKITDMSHLFEGEIDFNQDISGWDTGKVTNMEYMFRNAKSFNQDISGWNTGRVTNMKLMFAYAESFDQPLNKWDVSNVTNMKWMFQHTSFNQPLNHWDVSNVTTMALMFYQTSAFNQPLDKWNIENVRNMTSMFHTAQAFDQDITIWDVSKVVEHDYFSLYGILQNRHNPFILHKTINGRK